MGVTGKKVSFCSWEQRTELNGLVTAEHRPFFLNNGLFISGMKCPLSSGDY